VLSAVAKDPSPARRAVERRRALSLLGAGLWMLLVFGGLGGFRAVERPIAFVLGTGVGWAAIALLATWGSSRGGSMVGRPRSFVLFSIVLTPLALEVWYVAWALRADFAAAVAPIDRSALCALATVTMALAPFALFLLGRRGSDPNHPRATGAAMGVVAGAWGAVLIDLHCERADVLHVTLGHVVPALVLGIAGWVLGGALLGVRAEEP
jgi:hypothetical protein